MVIIQAVTEVFTAPLIVQQGAQPILERLPPPKRAAVLMAILALVMIGLTLVVCVMIGARWVRRLARQRPGEPHRTPLVTRANRPVQESLDETMPGSDMGATVQLHRSSAETRVNGGN